MPNNEEKIRFIMQERLKQFMIKKENDKLAFEH